MSLSLKHISVQIIVIIGLLASANILACTPDKEFNETISDTILSTTFENNNNNNNNYSASILKKKKVHQHAQMSSSLEARSGSSDKNCKCCEFGGCASCVGCSGSCGTATFSASSCSGEPANTPLGRFIQKRSFYASFTLVPFEHPPK